jgi:hypothetical protein
VDVVLVTYAPDLKLLRHAVASYDLYWRNKDSLIVFTTFEDRYLLDRIHFPSNTRFIYREDFDELTGADPFRQQTYLKLRAHEFVDTDDFVLLDSDFVLLNSIEDDDFYERGRPLWYYRKWIPNDLVRARWSESETFLGAPIRYAYLHLPQWVFRRHIARALQDQYDLRDVLNRDRLNEFLIYGAFAHRHFPQEYHFIDSAGGNGPAPLAGMVNQIPPTFCELDPDCHLEQFRQFKYVAFWSPWELAEAKVCEFFEASQLANFGSVVELVDQSPLRPNLPPGTRQADWHRYVSGLHEDGWVSDHLSLAVRAPSNGGEVQLDFTIPANPDDPNWKLRGYAAASSHLAHEGFALDPGEHSLTIRGSSPSPAGLCIDIHFEKGFRLPRNPDTREFRALFKALRVQEASTTAAARQASPRQHTRDVCGGTPSVTCGLPR